MVRQTLLSVLVVLGVTACAAGATPAPGAPPEAFVHRAATSDLVLLWNCLAPAAGGLRVEGVAQNPWQAQPIRFLELQLVGVDAQGRQTTTIAGKAGAIQIFTSQSSPFQLELRTSGTEVRFDLYYQYLFNEEFKDALLAGPPMVGLRLYAQTRTGLVRDACAPTQHLAR
jgi:hypothetical protein